MTKVNTAGTVDGLTGVLHMPSASRDVIALGSFLDQFGGELTFTDRRLHLHIDNKTILCAKRGESGLYDTCMAPADLEWLMAHKSKQAATHLSIHAQVIRERVHMLHRTLGHIGLARMRQVLERNNFTNIKPSHLELFTTCDACHSGKIQRRPANKKATRRPSEFGHTVAADTSSKQTIQTGRGKRYVNVSVDEATRWSWVTLLRNIGDTFEQATEPLLRQHLKGHAIRIFKTDQRGGVQERKHRQTAAKLIHKARNGRQ